MNIGLSSAAFYGRLETEDAAARLHELSVGVCEIFLETPSEYTRAFGETVARRLQGVECVSVHAKGTQFEPDLFGRSRRQVEDAMGIFAGVCDAGQAMGAKYYVFHGPNTAHHGMQPGDINALQERFGRMQAIAAERGMEVLWENVSWCTLRTPENVRQLKALLPGLHFVLDAKQAYRSGVELGSMVQAMGEDIRHVHVLDWDARGRVCLPGNGVADWPAFIRVLKQAGYDGTIILEPYEHLARDKIALRRCLAWLHGLILPEEAGIMS